MTHATRALQSHDLSGEGIKLWITYILFWPHKEMEGLPGWVISPMPGPPPKQHKHERQYTPKHTHSHPNKANMEWWLRRTNDIRGSWGGAKVSWQLSYRWGKTPKNLTQETCPDRGSNPGPLRDKRACYHLLHSGGLILQYFIKITVTILPISQNNKPSPLVWNFFWYPLKVSKVICSRRLAQPLSKY